VYVSKGECETCLSHTFSLSGVEQYCMTRPLVEHAERREVRSKIHHSLPLETVIGVWASLGLLGELTALPRPSS